MSARVADPVDAIDTPALVIDLDAMQRNLQRMAAFARDRQVRLRPHAKMHKSAPPSRDCKSTPAQSVCACRRSARPNALRRRA